MTQEFKATFAWMKGSLWRVFGFGFGSGLIRKAPGTWGTLFAWILWILISAILTNDLGQAVLIFICFAMGIHICQRLSNEMGIQDHDGIVWDEIVAFWLVLFVMAPLSVVWQFVAFIVFRFFDIVKPWPISYFDNKYKNGFGVMWDDIVAAVYTLFVIAVAVRVIGV